MFVANISGAMLYQSFQIAKMSQMSSTGAYFFGTSPLLFVIHILRREIRLRRELARGLSEFKLSEAECRNDFDREFIYAGILQWYGSHEAFTDYVRGPLRRELIGCTYFQVTMPAPYLLIICMGPVSTALEGVLALLTLDQSDCDCTRLDNLLDILRL